ncbi:MAG: N-formylglutamate amidohydrolase [Pseudomonadota bacterium]|nr:N-formylglutamate amidohydrolase [Pseudomonadota bacterium]
MAPSSATHSVPQRKLPMEATDSLSRADLRNRHWEITLGEGPVIATAVHDGHAIRDSLQRWLALGEDERLRDEDPLTGVLTTVGDVQLRVHTSRFEVDLNRPPELAVYTDPAAAWGLEVWNDELPPQEVQRSRETHAHFYRTVTALVDSLLARWDFVLLLDIHSYNHRRDGPHAPPADEAGNPDIDLGVTTLDASRFGNLVADFAQALRSAPLRDGFPDVRENVRYEGGGHFPEWLYQRYGRRICAISLEYKKIFMDEWTATADIAMLDDLRAGLRRAVDAVRPHLAAHR